MHTADHVCVSRRASPFPVLDRLAVLPNIATGFSYGDTGMRLAMWMTFGALAVLGASTAFAMSVAFEDNKLNLKDCDGTEISVRWNGDNFSLASDGKPLGRSHASFKSVDWDGACQTVSWNVDQAKFVIDTGSAKTSPIVKFVALDGARWVGMRNSDGFFVTRIAHDGQDVSETRISEVAAWLARTSSQFTPGEELAKHLTVTE